MNLPACLLEASDADETYVETGDLPGADLEHPTLVLRHVGGALAEVDVVEASKTGELRVRWRGATGAPSYVVHVTKTFPPGKASAKADPRGEIAGEVAEVVVRGPGLLWKGRAKAPLPWGCVDPSDALRIWKRLVRR